VELHVPGGINSIPGYVRVVGTKQRPRSLPVHD
jgi:hypothetical protein